MPGVIEIGTSGYVYKHWRRILYPDGLPASRWLERYAAAFAALELNATFYRLPSPEAARRWRRSTPEGFVFVAKGSRYLTHMKRLKDTGRGLKRFYGPARLLGGKLRAVLWQLPPNWSRPDPERLDAFLKAQPRGLRQAVEFRHPAWYNAEVCRVLERRGAAFCEHDHLELVPPRLTGGWRYLRFHGAGARYKGRYGRRRLARVAADLKRWSARGKDAFVFFNNDGGGAALYDAADLLALLGRRPPLRLPHQ